MTWTPVPTKEHPRIGVDVGIMPSAQGTACRVHYVTDRRQLIMNPETGQPFRLNGQPYALSIALCGLYGEWAEAPVDDMPVCLICASVWRAGGMSDAPRRRAGVEPAPLDMPLRGGEAAS